MTATATNEQVLVLSHAFVPVEVVHWTRAITLWWSGKCEILAEYDGFVRSTKLVIKIPAVVRLLRMFRKDKKPVKFSRISVYARDGYKCQYCGNKFRIGELTYDHVIPRSQGGRTEWTNIVSSCEKCNSRKANRTPEQAGMRLIKKPVQPASVPVAILELSSNIPDAWREWTYWNVGLDP